MEYAYIRVSTQTQNIDRQLDSIKDFNIDRKNIYIDYESGKDFNRKSYQKLIRKLKNGDILYVKSIDRLGRNYNMIIEEYRKITKTIKANIKILDMPLLDTSNSPNNLIKEFIADLVLQLLSFVAENERKNIKERQREGIKLALERGVKFGRPQITLTSKFYEAKEAMINNNLTLYEASLIADMTRSTFYKYLKIDEKMAK